jgi:hypothetical protein
MPKLDRDQPLQDHSGLARRDVPPAAVKRQIEQFVEDEAPRQLPLDIHAGARCAADA